MRKFLLSAVLVLIGLIAILFIAAGLQPAEYQVERSTLVEAPTSRLYGVLSDLHQFDEWSPWAKLDPNMTKSYDGPATGTGAIYSWEGNDKVGAGRMTIVSAIPDQQVDVKLEFFKPWASTSQTSWIISTENNQTKVTWKMTGRNDGVMAKTFALFMDMDQMIGKDFENGLASLKALAEKPVEAASNSSEATTTLQQ